MTVQFQNSSEYKKRKYHSNSIMSSSFKYGWQNLPDLFFSDVVVMVERGWLDELNDDLNYHLECELNDTEITDAKVQTSLSELERAGLSDDQVKERRHQEKI